MANTGSYPIRSFSENQTFLVYDPSTSTTARVRGSDLINYITPNLNFVYAESTRLAAENTDYQIGQLIQTSGATAVGDGLASVYLVVAGGTGDFPMINGNDLLVIAGDDNLREQLVSTDPGEGASRVSMEGGPSVQDAVTQNTSDIADRVIRKATIAEIEALTGVSEYQVSLSGPRKGIFEFSSSNLSTEVAADTEQGVYIAPSSDPTGASGAWVRQYGSELPNPAWFGGLTDGTLSDTALQACVNMFPGRRIALNDGEHNYSAFPTGIDSVRFEGSSRITWTNVKLPVFNGVITDGLETALVTGVIRYYPAGVNGAGWYLLVNQGENHDPILLEEVTASGNFSVILSVKFSDLGLDPALWTPSGVVVGPDETLAEEGVSVGASVNTSTIEIKGSVAQNIPEYIEYDGATWQGPSFYTFTWDTDHLIIDRDPAERREGVSSTKNSVMLQMAFRSLGTLIASAHVLEVDADTVHVYFYDFAGTKLASPTPNMRFFLMDPYLPASQYFFSQAAGSPGNIWIMGAFVRKPASL